MSVLTGQVRICPAILKPSVDLSVEGAAEAEPATPDFMSAVLKTIEGTPSHSDTGHKGGLYIVYSIYNKSFHPHGPAVRHASWADVAPARVWQTPSAVRCCTCATCTCAPRCGASAASAGTASAAASRTSTTATPATSSWPCRYHPHHTTHRVGGRRTCNMDVM